MALTDDVIIYYRTDYGTLSKLYKNGYATTGSSAFTTSLLPTLTATGHTFTCWCYDVDRTQPVSIGELVGTHASDMTLYLYALWDAEVPTPGEPEPDPEPEVPTIPSGPVSKVEFGGNILIDLTSDTVDASHLAEGYTAHDKAGALITGTMQQGSTDVPFRFGGLNATLVDNWTKTYTLADTSFVIGSTAPSTATSIRAAASKEYAGVSHNYGDKDVIVLQRVIVTPVHQSTATKKAYQQRYVNEYITGISKVGYTSSGTYRENYYRRNANASISILRHYNTSGVDTYTATSYGLYATCQAPTSSSTTAATQTISINSPVLYARYSASYETQANMKLISACTFQWNVRIWEVDPQSSPFWAMYNDAETIWR